MRKALAIVFLTVGLSSIPFLALGGYRPTIADAQAGPTVVLVAALSSIALGSLLFVQVGKSATAKAYNLTTLARFHSEAMALFYRAQGITDDKQTPQLETELNTWQGGVSEWLQAHLPIYAPTFLEAARKNTIFYRHTEGETVPGERVPYRANLIANHAQERAEMIGRIMRSVAGQEPD